MTLEEFRATLEAPSPLAAMAPPLLALWWAAKGEWDKAHAIVMDDGSCEAAWVHAYLHRVEGDLNNARYWYHQARRTAATGSLSTEWDEIAAALL